MKYQFLFMDTSSWWLEVATGSIVASYITYGCLDENEEIPLHPSESNMAIAIDFDSFQKSTTNGVEAFIPTTHSEGLPKRVSEKENRLLSLLVSPAVRQSTNLKSEALHYATIGALNISY